MWWLFSTSLCKMSWWSQANVHGKTCQIFEAFLLSPPPHFHGKRSLPIGRISGPFSKTGEKNLLGKMLYEGHLLQPQDFSLHFRTIAFIWEWRQEKWCNKDSCTLQFHCCRELIKNAELQEAVIRITHRTVLWNLKNFLLQFVCRKKSCSFK